MKTIFISIIKLYKLLISPIFPQSCRFYPSCSDYAMESIDRYGIFKGVWLAARRITKCHPFHQGGYDPVP
jgi:uncharacterized protein